jgi:hypothetical protein
MYRKVMVIITLATGVMFPVTCMHVCVWEILRRWSTCAVTTYEVVRDCRMFRNGDVWYEL